MADLVLGLAKSAVEGTLTVAKSAIEEEQKLKKSMQRDLMLISDEFEMMHSFLNVAKDRDPDEMVRTLVRQVRNMALDVEDCIETVVLVDLKSRWWRRMIPACLVPDGPADALDAAVTAAELLMSRVEAMGQRNERYWHIRDTGSKPTEKASREAVADAAAAVGILTQARDARKKHGNGIPRDLVELINKTDPALPLQVISAPLRHAAATELQSPKLAAPQAPPRLCALVEPARSASHRQSSPHRRFRPRSRRHGCRARLARGQPPPATLSPSRLFLSHPCDLVMLIGSPVLCFSLRFRRSAARRRVRRCELAGVRGQPSTDPLRPQFVPPRVRQGMEMLQYLFLAADEHQPTGTEPCRRRPLFQFARRTPRDNLNFSRGFLRIQ